MLSDGVTKLHEMGITIHDELEDQEEYLSLSAHTFLWHVCVCVCVCVCVRERERERERDGMA